MNVVRESGLWVNRELVEGMPMFAYGVRRSGELAVLIFVNEVVDDQLTLYYQNLFRIICGLVESSLLRAFEYEDAVRDSRLVRGTRVLNEAAFLAEVESERVLREDRMSSFLLLRVIPGQEPLAELMGGIASAIRESDAAGLVGGDTLYLLMRQASPDDYPIIECRLARHDIACEVVDDEGIFALTAPYRASDAPAAIGGSTPGEPDGGDRA